MSLTLEEIFFQLKGLLEHLIQKRREKENNTLSEKSLSSLLSSLENQNQKNIENNKYKLFVCNISFYSKEHEIRNLFKKCVDFKLVEKKNEFGKIIKKFAFITFSNHQDREKGLMLHGYRVDDRNLIVKINE